MHMTDKPKPEPMTFRVEERNEAGEVIYERTIVVEPDADGNITPPDIWEF
jgi:hypothetical protein